MNRTDKMLVGVAGSAVLSIAWDLYPGHNMFKLADNPLAVVEHYHIGLITMIAARTTKKYGPYLDGLGAGLIASEAGQAEPFGWNHPTFGASTIIGLTLASILALSF
jgi:hypothetical protein